MPMFSCINTSWPLDATSPAARSHSPAGTSSVDATELANTFKYLKVCVCECVCVNVCVYLTCLCIWTQTYIHIYSNVYMHVNIHVHDQTLYFDTYIHTYICIYVCTYTHIHKYTDALAHQHLTAALANLPCRLDFERPARQDPRGLVIHEDGKCLCSVLQFLCYSAAVFSSSSV